MPGRGAIHLLVGGIALLLVAGMAASGQTQTAARIPFVIATGPTGGTYFPVGEAIAAIISHPPGVYRCEKKGVCGPPGLIASARTSPGAVFNVIAVNAHTVDAGLAQSDVVAEAAKGRGSFARTGPQSHVRVIADLFPEAVHVVVSKKAKIKTIADLKGKRVGIGPELSGTTVTAHAILTAYRLSARRLKLNHDPSDIAAEKLANGKLDAMFFVGGAPVPLVRDLLASDDAVVIPITGAPRARLLKAVPALTADTIPAGIYPNTAKVETVSARAIWIVNDTVSDSIVYAVTKALFNQANRAALTASHRSAGFIRLETAASDLPVPLHSGARHFYVEAGTLPKKQPSKQSAPARSGKT